MTRGFKSSPPLKTTTFDLLLLLPSYRQLLLWNKWRFELPNQLHAFFYIKEEFYKNNEAQICPKSKNKLRTFEVRRQMQCNYRYVFIEKHNTMLLESHDKFLRLIVFWYT